MLCEWGFGRSLNDSERFRLHVHVISPAASGAYGGACDRPNLLASISFPLVLAITLPMRDRDMCL
jgi:hypothetical protein